MGAGLRVLGIVTARGGSRSVPRKNIRLLCGKPLLAWTAEAALAAKRLARVVLSTEDEEIAEVGRRCGLEVPFLRPPELARDDTPTLPVLRDAVRRLEAQGERYDAICLLQPTCPLRRAEHIDGCIELLERAGADAVVTVLEVPAKYNPHWVYFQEAATPGEAGIAALRLSTGEAAPIPRRQDLPPAFHREGSVYVTRRDALMEQGSLYGERLVGFVMDPAESVNIDAPEDWARAERLLRTRG
jgi:CMP-N-acetylneuraminic acid synthetase